MPSSLGPTNPLPPELDLDVRGALPPALAGRLVGVGHDGIVHSLRLRSGQVSCSAHSIHTGAAVADLVVFDGTILLHAEDLSVHQLTVETGAVRRVELAGHRRTVAASPKFDPSSGELHLVADDWGGGQSHVVVPAGALTRRSRPVVGAPARIRGLAIGRDHLILVADGAAAVASRSGELHAAWVQTGVAAPVPIHTWRVGDTVVLLALTPSLERWTLHPDAGTVERGVLDPTPRSVAVVGECGPDGAPLRAWTTGGETIAHHDLLVSRHAHHSLSPGRPGDFVVVPDSAHPDRRDDGWLAVLVHDPTDATTDLRVSSTADIARATATTRIPRPTAQRLRLTWMPAMGNDPQHAPTPEEDTP